MIDAKQLELYLASKSAAPRVTLADVNGAIVSESYTVLPNGRTTVCQLTLENGFTVEGYSAAVSAANYNKPIGDRIARENAVRAIWPLLGFMLAEDMVRDARLLADREFAKGPVMTTYIGTKVIDAIPMNRADYNVLRGWDLPADEDGADEGYLVEYTDKIQNPPHVEGFLGYVSWSPKDVFERAYRAAGSGASASEQPKTEGRREATLHGHDTYKSAAAHLGDSHPDGLTNGSFGQAIDALKAGKRVRRAGWNGKGMWLALSGPTGAREVAAYNFWSPHNAEYARSIGGTAKVLPCITMKVATGEILMGWLASQTDMLAEDWEEVVSTN